MRQGFCVALSLWFWAWPCRAQEPARPESNENFPPPPTQATDNDSYSPDEMAPNAEAGEVSLAPVAAKKRAPRRRPAKAKARRVKGKARAQIVKKPVAAAKSGAKDETPKLDFSPVPLTPVFPSNL